ncbi:hypothetical protein ACW2Q0_28395 [Nocardia sp. R16R-3T]
MADWTPAELELLGQLAHRIGHCIADPDDAIQHLRDGHGCGGGAGFRYEFTQTAILGHWHEWIPVAWAASDDIRPAGQPIKWREGALLREARVSYRRLQRWCESLPAEVRAQALTWWRTYPENTRDLAALIRLTRAALASEFDLIPGARPTQSTLFDL